jgi:hypothetical protein
MVVWIEVSVRLFALKVLFRTTVSVGAAATETASVTDPRPLLIDAADAGAATKANNEPANVTLNRFFILSPPSSKSVNTLLTATYQICTASTKCIPLLLASQIYED